MKYKGTNRKKTVGYILACLIIYAFSMFLFAGPSAPASGSFTLAPGSYRISLVKYDWHVGLVIPAKQLKKANPLLAERFPAAEHFELGWGDKGFYQAEKVTAQLIFNAMLWPSPATMHVVGINEVFDLFNSKRHSEIICLDEKQFSQLLQFVHNSFERDSLNMLIQDVAGIYGNSQFYDATGNYNMTYTCNKWVANALKSAGFEISTHNKLTSESIIKYAKKKREESFNEKENCIEAK